MVLCLRSQPPDGSVDIDELDLLFKTINLDKFSDSAKTQIQSYTASPPSLSDCLQTLSQSEEPLRLGVMYFLINIAGANKTLAPAESEAIQSAKKLLAVSDLQIQAMQEFIADIKQIRKPPLIKIRHQPPSLLLFPSLKLRAFLSI